MSRTKWLTFVAILPATWLWTVAAAGHGGSRRVLAHLLAGIIATLALVWTARRFAMRDFNRRTAAFSTLIGVLYTTPIITMLLGNNADATGSSTVVVGLTALAVAAMLGAVWGVAGSTGEALTEWRDNHSSATSRLKLGALHK